MGRIFKTSFVRKHSDGSKTVHRPAGWYGEYRDLSNRVRRAALTTDKRQASTALNALEEALNKVRAGMVVTPDELPPLVRKAFYRALREADIRGYHAEHADVAIDDHVEEYRRHLISKGVCRKHLSETIRRLKAVIAAGGFKRLGEIDPAAVDAFLALRAEKEASPRTRNTYLVSIRTFAGWCVKTGRMASNPLTVLAKADESRDVRRKRRALTEEELQRLLMVARWRPLAEYGRLTKKKPAEERKGRSTWEKAELTLDAIEDHVKRAREILRLKPPMISRLEKLGRERELTYATLVHTGLRRGELSRLPWEAVDLDGNQPAITISGEHSKNGHTDVIPLRADLVQMLKAWRAECGARSPKQKALRVPNQLVQILKRDLAVAGIARVDEAGRQIDVHALRHTTATHLAKAGVAPRTAQAIMRHSTVDLTMSVYCDPRLLEFTSALHALPRLTPAAPAPMEQRATGSCDSVPRAASTQRNSGEPMTPTRSAEFSAFLGWNLGVSGAAAGRDVSTADAPDDAGGAKGDGRKLLRSGSLDAACRQAMPPVGGSRRKRVTRFERATTSLEGWYSTIELHPPRRKEGIGAVFASMHPCVRAPSQPSMRRSRTLNWILRGRRGADKVRRDVA